MKTVGYDITVEEAARQGWNLANRDRFVMRLARRAAGGSVESLRIVDVGCGTGGAAQRLVSAGAVVVGVDPDQASLDLGVRLGRLREVRAAEVTDLPFPDRSFDIAVASEVLEHVEDDDRGLAELCRIARRGVVITAPAHDYLWTDSDEILLHKRRYSRRQFAQLLRTSDWRVRSYGAFGMLPATAVLGYKLVTRDAAKRMRGERRHTLPLSARYRLPLWIDRALEGVFFVESSLAARRLIPWGAHWWAILSPP